MVATEKQRLTVEQYLEMERASEEKHEYLDGEIYLMARASGTHSTIQINAAASLHGQLRQRPCLVLLSNMRVRVSDTGLYTYPDVIVVCDAPQLEDEAEQDTLLNPTLIIGVLSPSTEGYDRGKKFQQYRRLESLQEYVLIAQESPRMERYLRQPDHEWLLADAAGLEASIALTSIECTLALAEVYAKVSFEPSA